MNTDKKTGIHGNSLQSNFIWNVIRIAGNLVLPLVILPHVTRVLGPEHFGKTEYAASFVAYFVLFTAIGIPIYGTREIARCQNSLGDRSKTLWEFTLLLCASTGIGYVIYFALVFFVPVFHADLRLFAIIAPLVFLTNCNYEWFYIGIEQQRSITIRSLLVKSLQVMLIFYFVRQSRDFIRYIVIIVFSAGFQAAWNIFRLRKFVQYIPFAGLNIKRHIRPLLAIFAAVIFSGIYMNIDTIMVEIISGSKSVGIYAAANRIIRFVVIFIVSISGVLIPRIENSLHSGNFGEYRQRLNTSLRLHLLFAFPCICGMFLLAPEIIHIMAGAAYNEAIFSARLLCPIIVIVPLANFIGFHTLYPNRKEKYYTIAVFVSALLNIICNYCLIPRYKQNGAVMGTLAAETVGLGILSFFARKLLRDTELFSLNSLKYVMAACIMAVPVYFVRRLLESDAFSLTVCVVLGACIYAVALMLLGEKMSKAVLKRVLAIGRP